MKKYSVLTYIIGEYEIVQEIEEKDPDAEYILITDNPRVSSKTWNVYHINFPQNTSTFDRCYAIRFNPFKYCTTDICLRIDGSIRIKKSTKKIIDDFISSGADMALMIHPERNTFVPEYNQWIKTRGYPLSEAKKCLYFMAKCGYNLTYKGLYQGCFNITKKNKICDDVNRMTYSFLKFLGNDTHIQRICQTIWSFVINRFFSDTLKVFPVTEDLITHSNYFQWYMHRSNTPIKQKTNIEPFLFNEPITPNQYTYIEDPNLNNDVDIFITTISDIEKYPTNKCYNLITLGDTELKNQYPMPIFKDNCEFTNLNKSICEFTGIYSIYKNHDLKDYVGFCQYRRFFVFFNNIPNIKQILQTNDIILGRPIVMKQSIIEQYTKYHNVNDLSKIVKICNEKYPEYNETIKFFLKSHKLYACNMFIMKKEDFIKYCEFISTIISEFIKTENLNSYEDCIAKVENDKINYLKTFGPNKTVDYQSRFMAYLVERLTNIFIIHNFNKSYNVDIVETSKKYSYNLFKELKDE